MQQIIASKRMLRTYWSLVMNTEMDVRKKHLQQKCT